MIELVAVGRRYGDRIAVEDVSLQVAPGELVALVGASGSGKTTTLKMVNRLIEPTTGIVRVAGRDVSGVSGPALRRGIGYCFQQIGLFPHLSVAENVGVVPSLLGWDATRIRRRVAELLSWLELPAELGPRAPAELSGGQQQRVGIARALAGEPDVLLMDEPFGALDPITRETLQQRFQEIRRELGITTLFVTHDMVEALRLADRIAVLDHGRLVQIDAPQRLLRAPATDVVVQLLATPRRQAAALEPLLAGRA
ncbi:ABC transporter ATP-binding protein [Myxococcota bacterium]|nr:ABC transporter ATP-binding protein [Myxococcota bacterium]MCZ7619248.1 ABC transporter ATP-binding protein [Myxococcota bacterium]